MLKVSKAEEKPSLEALMERHIAAQTATVNAVREWDARRAAGDVSPVQYANALLPLSREEEAARVAIVLYKPFE